MDAEQGARGPAALGPHFVNLGRVAGPGEQAAVIVLLASDAASNINGAILPVAGGVGGGLTRSAPRPVAHPPWTNSRARRCPAVTAAAWSSIGVTRVSPKTM